MIWAASCSSGNDQASEKASHANRQALTVVLQHEVHVRNGAQPQRILAVADAVDVLRDLLHPLIQPDGLAQLTLLTNVPDIGSKVDWSMMSWQQGSNV